MARRCASLRLRRPFGAALFLALAPVAAAQEQGGRGCTDFFQFRDRDFIEVPARTRRDQVCVVNYGRYALITGYRLTQRPRNGVIGSAGYQEDRWRTAYRPNPGFVGQDAFEVEVSYVARGPRAMPSRIRIRFLMQVAP